MPESLHRWPFRRGGRPRPNATIDVSGYRRWIEQFDALHPSERDTILDDIETIEPLPKITVVALVRESKNALLTVTVESLRRQLYRRWQLLLLDVSGDADLPATLGDDPRIEFGKGQSEVEIRMANAFLTAAQGSYVVFVEAGDTLSETALYCVARTGIDDPAVEILYSDEDRVDDEGRRHSPRFKPDWSPDLLYSYNYIGGLMACKIGLAQRVGGFRSGSKDCLLYDFLLRSTEGLSRERVHHLPEILYHRRGPDLLERSIDSAESRTVAVTDLLTPVDPHLEVLPGQLEGTNRLVWSIGRPCPWVSVIIPTRNQLELLQRCLDSLRSITEYEAFEAVVVDNQSDDLECLAYLDSIRGVPGIRVVELDAPFNYSALNNIAVQESEGEVLAFLNNDVEILSAGWLREMVSHALRPKVGAVGAKLLYPNETVQHGGVVLGGGAKKDAVAAHHNWGLERSAPGYLGDNQVVRNLSAVTAACMVIRREIFDGVGGFDESNLEVAFNDVDLCLRLGELGYWIVWTPYAELMHHESKSRGSDRSRKKRERFGREVSYMRRRWSNRLDDERLFSANLDILRPDGALAFPPRRQRPWERS